MAKQAKKEQPVSTRAPEKRRAKPEDDVGNQAFSRIANRAYLRYEGHTYTNEQLMLALLLATQGDVKRKKDDVEHVQKMMKDHNLD